MMKIYYYFIFFIYCLFTSIQADSGFSNKNFNFFINDIHKELQFFRINFDSDFSNISIKAKNSIFEVRIHSRRNNYGEIIIMTAGVMSRYLSKVMDDAIINNSIIFTPTIITIHCVSFQGRDKVILSISLNSKLLMQFGRGEVSAGMLWSYIKNNISSSKDFIDDDIFPEIFISEYDF